jgi:hypothetical protein
MNTRIDIASALRQLPLETPEHSAWEALKPQLPTTRTGPKWPLALVASSALAVLLWRSESILPIQNGPQTASLAAPSALQQSMARSVQLEPYFYASQDDSISSASVIAANLDLEARLSAIDARLQEQPTAAEALTLWRERVAVLDQGIALNRANAQTHDDGQNFDLVLASLN